jgi:hypothetical protein
VFSYPPVLAPAPRARGSASVTVAGTEAPPPAKPSNRKRRKLVLAGAAFAALVGIGGIGFAEFAADDGSRGSPIGLPLIPATPSAEGLPPSSAGSAPGGSPVSHGGSPSPGAHSPTDDTGLSPVAGDTTGVVPPPAAPSSGSPFAAVPPGDPAPASPTRNPAALAPTSADASAGAVTGPGGLCLAAAGARVQTATCDGGADQRWTVGTDGTLQVSGRCADAGADSVTTVACGDDASSRWRTGSNRSVVNVGTGECLTDPVGGARAGTAVTVTTCNAGTNQQWTLP